MDKGHGFLDMTQTNREPASLPAIPSPNRRRNPNKSAEQIGGPIFQQNRFPVPWILVRGSKRTFLSVAL